MARYRVILAGALLCLSACTGFHRGEISSVRPEAVGLSSDGLREVDEALQGFVERGEVAGAVTVIARRGKIAYAKTFGKKDIASGERMTLDTIFRIYSMTKPITSVAVMMLYEEGKLDLDDAVSQYLPELGGVKVYESGTAENPTLVRSTRVMTIRDLLRHTSGLATGGDGPVGRLYNEAKVREGSLSLLVKRLAKVPLLDQPGTRWVYGPSTDVLGRIVEVVSEKSLDVFFEERIFAPLDMHDSGFSVPEEKLHRFATNYGPKPGGGIRVVDDPATSKYRSTPLLFSGGGGMVSTARDYLRFCQMILNGGTLNGRRILKPETVAEMTKNQVPESAMPIGLGQEKRTGVGFGLGFYVRVARGDTDPASRVGEIGWGGWASTHFWLLPKKELVVIALEQHVPFRDRIRRKIKGLIYDALLSE